MGTKRRALEHVITGGLATDLGSRARVSRNRDGALEIDFLLRADNVYYTTAGGVRKIGGTSKYNSSALESGAAIRGAFEYVRAGTAGSITRKRIAVVDDTIKADDNDGSFANLFTSLNTSSVPAFSVFTDLLIVTTDANESPKKYDQSSAAALGGTPPNFAFTCVHANRLWAAGDPAAPSTLYYSSLLEPEEWEGIGDSGTLDIDSDDGDVITALRVFRGELLVFKGSQYGSIHRISGLTPATFSRTVTARGVSAAGHNLVFPMKNTLGFVANDGTIREIRGSDTFGDLDLGTISDEIESWLSLITFSSLKKGWAVNNGRRGYVLISLPVDASATPNSLLMLDYRKQRTRYATWSAIDAYSLALMSDSSASNRLIVFAGGSDGFLRKLEQTSQRTDTSTSISALVQTPFMDYGTPFDLKTLTELGVGINPRGDYDINIGYRLTSGDDVIQGDEALSQGGGAVLDEFMLDDDVLGGDSYATRLIDEFNAGQFREVSYVVGQSGLSEDMDLEVIFAGVEGAIVEAIR